MKYNDNGEYKDIYIKTFDTLPVGAEVDYDGETVPEGWSEIADPSTYSTSEVRIGTYKNKPLYRKMLEFTTPGTANTNTEVATFDTTFTVRNFYGNIDVSSTGQVLPLNFYFSNEYLVATYPENGTGKVKMKVGTSAYTSLNVDMFIEYTKTTD